MRSPAVICSSRRMPTNTSSRSCAFSANRASAIDLPGPVASGCSRTTRGPRRCSASTRSSPAASSAREASGRREAPFRMPMKISIFGLGYVGAVSLACLARDGHTVVGVDVDAAKLDLIASGRTPVVEEGMIDLVDAVVKSGRVRVTQDARAAVLETSVSLVCVGTPSAPNGSQDQSAMLRLAHQMGEALKAKPADRKSTRLNSSHSQISYAVFCLKKKKKKI